MSPRHLPRWLFRLQHRLSLTHNEFVAVTLAVTLLAGGEVARRFLPEQPRYDDAFYRARDSLFFALSSGEPARDTTLAADSASSVRGDTLHRHEPAFESVAPDGRIDINVASVTELVRLPGIGPRLAQRIIDFRDTQGPFKEVAELRRVSGIGPRKLETLAPLVFVDR